jgi:hypothetical protein
VGRLRLHARCETQARVDALFGLFDSLQRILGRKGRVRLEVTEQGVARQSLFLERRTARQHDAPHAFERFGTFGVHFETRRKFPMGGFEFTLLEQLASPGQSLRHAVGRAGLNLKVLLGGGPRFLFPSARWAARFDRGARVFRGRLRFLRFVDIPSICSITFCARAYPGLLARAVRASCKAAALCPRAANASARSRWLSASRVSVVATDVAVSCAEATAVVSNFSLPSSARGNNKPDGVDRPIPFDVCADTPTAPLFGS